MGNVTLSLSLSCMVIFVFCAFFYRNGYSCNLILVKRLLLTLHKIKIFLFVFGAAVFLLIPFFLLELAKYTIIDYQLIVYLVLFLQQVLIFILVVLSESMVDCF